MNKERVYYLMHRNDIVTTLSFDIISGKIMQVGRKVNKELLPPGANLTQEDLKKWWERRAVPLNQGNIKLLLRENQIPTTQSYLLQNLGMSLSDHYWINPVDICYQWKDVNLFTNDFRDEIGNFGFKESLSENNRIVNLQNRTIFYPSASLQGELQKKWVLQNGKRYLIKGNYGNSCQQSINEVIASMIHEKQENVSYTKYRLCDIDVAGNKGIGCLCEDFCTEDIEFISAYDIVNSAKKKNDISIYEHFIGICMQNGLEEEKVREFLEYQIISDFVITNTDRHLYNFGILRDSKTLAYLKMAPIFDSGNSMFWNWKQVPCIRELLDITVNSFLTREAELLRYIKDTARLDMDKLPSEDEVMELLCLDQLCEERSVDILKGYKGKVQLLELFQSGEKIYQYGFAKKLGMSGG